MSVSPAAVELIRRIRRKAVTLSEFERILATLPPEDQLLADEEWLKSTKSSGEVVDLTTLNVSLANGNLDKDLIKEAASHRAWGPRSANLRAYGDKQSLVAYDEDTATDHRTRLNDIIRDVAIQIGISPRRFILRGASLDHSGRPKDKKFYQIELLRLQELAKELVEKGRHDLMGRVTTGWTLGDYNLMADFLEGDKALKGVRSSAEVGSEIKDDQLTKVITDHRKTMRPVLEGLKNQSEGWKAVWEAHKKAAKGQLDPEEVNKLKTGKTLLEDKWTYAVLDGDKVLYEKVNSNEPDAVLVWANDTFKAVANTPDLEYYVIRLAPDNTPRAGRGEIWDREEQLELAQNVGKSEQLLAKMIGGTGIQFSEFDLIRQETMIGEIYSPSFSSNKGLIGQRIEQKVRHSFAHSTTEHRATGWEGTISSAIFFIALLVVGFALPGVVYTLSGGAIKGPTGGWVMAYALILIALVIWATMYWSSNLSKAAVTGQSFWRKWFVIGIATVFISVGIFGLGARTDGNRKSDEIYNNIHRTNP